jgi:hypothetical protein
MPTTRQPWMRKVGTRPRSRLGINAWLSCKGPPSRTASHGPKLILYSARASMIEIGESWENAPQLYPARLTQLANTAVQCAGTDLTSSAIGACKLRHVVRACSQREAAGGSTACGSPTVHERASPYRLSDVLRLAGERPQTQNTAVCGAQIRAPRLATP